MVYVRHTTADLVRLKFMNTHQSVQLRINKTIKCARNINNPTIAYYYGCHVFNGLLNNTYTLKSFKLNKPFQEFSSSLK